MNQITIRNLPFHNVTMQEAILLAEAELQKDGMSLVVTPNAEIAQLCLEDEAVHRILASAELILPDGAGVIMAAKILGTPLKEKVAGVEFGMQLLSLAEKKGYRVFLLGGKPTVAELAAEALRKTMPHLQIVGIHDGYFTKTGAETDAVIEKINASRAEILLICLGAPTQEIWAHENRKKLSTIRLAACLGGSLDIYAGTAKRAPKLFIKLRLEWFWRLLREPYRLPRMMQLPKYIQGAKKEARKQKRGKR